MIMKRIIILALFILPFALVSCGRSEGTGSGTAEDVPARAVEEYLSAKVRSDVDAVRAGLCAAMESELERESRAFESVSNATIDNMSCASDDPTHESQTVVRCSGEIVALYGTEETQFPLGAYQAVIEDGEWQWCGETR